VPLSSLPLCSLRPAQISPAPARRSHGRARPCARVLLCPALAREALCSPVAPPCVGLPCKLLAKLPPLLRCFTGRLPISHSAFLLGAQLPRSCYSPWPAPCCARPGRRRRAIESRPPFASRCSLVRVLVGVVEFCLVGSSLTLLVVDDCFRFSAIYDHPCLLAMHFTLLFHSACCRCLSASRLHLP
jgi:hypothetical protein